MSKESTNSDKKKEMIERYNKTSHFYDDRYRRIQNEKCRTILKNLDIKAPKILEGKLILDGGAGTGLLFEFLQDNIKEISDLNYIYVATDLSLNMLKIFMKKVNNVSDRTRTRLNLILSDLENLPFRDGCFDSIFLLTSVQNLPHQFSGLKESMRAGKKGADFNLSILRKKLNKKRLVNFLKKELNSMNIIDNTTTEDLIILGNIV